MPTTGDYSPSFFTRIQNGSLESAREVVPHLLELLRPDSVADLGCGTGAWLAAFLERGIQDIQGVDGDYVRLSSLLIPPERFLAADLCKPLSLGRRYDLVLSLEVAEHLPASSAGVYLDNLVRLGDIVVFSAAIPQQTGEGHVNEQWPSYWKALWAERGYEVVDCLRPLIWGNRNIERWYRQNLLLFVQKEHLKKTPALKAAFEKYQDGLLDIVHPATFAAPSFSGACHMLTQSISRSITRRLIAMRGRRGMTPGVGAAAQQQPLEQRPPAQR